MAELVKIGMIGVGFIGEYHIGALGHVAQAKVAAISDPNRARLDEIAEKYGIAAAYADPAEMLARETLDGVVIATPDHLHREPVEMVAAAGLPMLLEKPIATTLEDAQAIIEAVDRAGVKTALGFTIRFKPTYAAIKKAFADGTLGVAHTAHAARYLNISEARRYDGRCSVNQYVACHDLDFLLWVLGPGVESIYTVRADSRAFKETGEADSYLSILKWENGAVASVLVTWGMPDAFPLAQDEVLIVGSKGMANKGRTGAFEIVTDKGVEEVDFDPALNAFQAQAQAFVDMVRFGTEPKASVIDGLRAQKLTLAAEASIQQGQPIDVDL